MLKEKRKMALLYPIFDIGKNINNVISEDKYFYFKNKILTGKQLYITKTDLGKDSMWVVDDITNNWYMELTTNGSGGTLICNKRLNKSFYQSLWALNIKVINNKQDVAALQRRYTIEDIVKDD